MIEQKIKLTSSRVKYSTLLVFNFRLKLFSEFMKKINLNMVDNPEIARYNYEHESR